MDKATRSHQTMCFLLLLLTLASAASAAPVTFQDGLPPALVIAAPQGPDGSLDANALRQQASQLEALALWAKEHQPKTGFLDKLLGSPTAARPVSLEDLARYASSLKGQRVRVEGLFTRSSEAAAEFSSGTNRCLINLAEGTVPEGFPSKDIFGLPVAAEGTVEVRQTIPVIRADTIQPSAGLALLRLARIHELLGESDKAVATYLEAERAIPDPRSSLRAFARVSAGRICYDQLRDKAKAAANYNAAWTTYVTNVPQGSPPVVVWIPAPPAKSPEQTNRNPATPRASATVSATTSPRHWVELPVSQAIGEPLDKLNSESFWYHFVAFFVALCGGNAALGVLLIALVVRIAVWPLTKKQLQSAEAMKRIQPQIKELQARFADDKQRFQQEFWKLCKANGANPLGGCFPLLIQMPVLIMVYKGIQLYIVEFSKASFLWVNNLAGPDMILLVAYTLSMILFQKMTMKTNPQAGLDPQQEQQQKIMMYMMPLMFFFMFKSFPASFILYWLGTNIIYFLQQWHYTRKLALAEGAATPDTAQSPVRRLARWLSGEPTPSSSSEGQQPTDTASSRPAGAKSVTTRSAKSGKRGRGK